MSEYPLQDAVEAALGAARADDVIDGVKSLVERQLRSLDPRADIHRTEYFNHSFVPDFVVSWRERRQPERNVYIRNSLASSVAAREVADLGADGPILLGLREQADDKLVVQAQSEAKRAPNVLLTSVKALDQLPSRGAVQRSPLEELVRNNIVRGARGVLGPDQIERLTPARRELGDADPSYDLAALEDFDAEVSEAFAPDAALRIRRAGRLLQAGITGDLGAFFELSADASASGGRLSDAELRALLPYLLSDPRVTRNREYWAYLGSLFDLERLEAIASDLRGLDLTPLLAANAQSWRAARSAAVLNVDYLEDEASETGWRISANTAALIIGPWRVHVTADNRRLRGRDDSIPARWEDLRSALQGWKLAVVRLDGVARQVRVTEGEGGDVLSDVTSIASTIQDAFHVPAVVVRPPANADDMIEADFRRMLSTAERSASVADLTRAAIEILGYRYPVDPRALAEALGVTAIGPDAERGPE